MSFVIVECYGFDEGRSGYGSMFELLALNRCKNTFLRGDGVNSVVGPSFWVLACEQELLGNLEQLPPSHHS